ncbi:hypothetical protein QQZ08_010853, partial [Neonectria magnoliae]
MSASIPSADAPLESVTTTLLKTLQADGYYALFLKFPTLANNIRNARLNPSFRKVHIGTEKTVSSFDSELKLGWTLAKLTAAIPKKGLEAIMRGTVAYDSITDPNIGWYPRKGPGIYVVGLAVSGRAGKWLSRNEIEQLRRLIKQYCRGYMALVNGASVSNSDVLFVRSVDGQFPGSVKGRKSRFIDNADELARVNALHEALGRRCSTQSDPTGDVFQIQSPLYVGCSDKLQNRTQDYLKPNVNNINKPLGLTMSLTSETGKPAQVFVQVENQLPVAERLVTTLANSYVCQDGFNATEAGGKLGGAKVADFAEAEIKVYARNKHLEENIDAVLNDTVDRIDCLTKLEDLIAVQNDVDRHVEEIRTLHSATSKQRPEL